MTWGKQEGGTLQNSESDDEEMDRAQVRVGPSGWQRLGSITRRSASRRCVCSRIMTENRAESIHGARLMSLFCRLTGGGKAGAYTAQHFSMTVQRREQQHTQR